MSPTSAWRTTPATRCVCQYDKLRLLLQLWQTGTVARGSSGNHRRDLVLVERTSCVHDMVSLANKGWNIQCRTEWSFTQNRQDGWRNTWHYWCCDRHGTAAEHRIATRRTWCPHQWHTCVLGSGRHWHRERADGDALASTQGRHVDCEAATLDCVYLTFAHKTSSLPSAR